MLLFGVQPMVARTILPHFGGTAAVWVVCLCAFQSLLVGGYFYADRLISRSKSLKSHIWLLIVAAVWTFCVGCLRNTLGEFLALLPPAIGVLSFIVIAVAPAYLVLSANATLVQSVASTDGKDSYRLYAVSNLGSFAGLLLYPFAMEPFVSVPAQWHILSAGILLYAAMLWQCVPRVSSQNVRLAAVSEPPRPLPGSVVLPALAIPAVTCALLNSITAYLTMEVVALPLLWCALLSAFLLSYVVGFSGVGQRVRPIVDALSLVAVFVTIVVWHRNGSFGFRLHLLIGISLVFFLSTSLHLRLYAMRPGAEGLSRFYLLTAIGGAVGGVLTSLVAPCAFSGITEYPIALVVAVVLLAVWNGFRCRAVRMSFVLFLALFACGILFRAFLERPQTVEELVLARRGFFGTLRVNAIPAKAGDVVGRIVSLAHGATEHGSQIQIPGRERTPTSYYTPTGGGLAILQHPKYKRGKSMRVGVVGLGIGVTCAYSRPGDVYRLYEISPEVLSVATDTNFFTFVSGSPCKIETVLGDARRELAREREAGAPKFDVLQIDAFSGDAIPYHLSTKEAFDLYFSRLAPGGFLSVNISNWHLDLRRLIKAVVTEFGWQAIVYLKGIDDSETPAVWALFVKEPPKEFSLPPGIILKDLAEIPDWLIPTDEKGSLLRLLY